MADKTRWTSVCDEARQRFALILDVDKDNRDNQKSDTKFVYSPGEQWPEETRRQREGWKEVCLEFNQLKQFVAQVVNDQRQNRPGIRIHAASGDASVETAQILQGMIRGIEYESKAEAAYDNAFQQAVVGGRGWIRICSEYTSDKGFDQKLLIKPIADGLTVYASLDYEEPDASDREYLFVVEAVAKDEFPKRWPKAEPANWDDIDKAWALDDKYIYVADYYRRICKKRTMVRMSDGAEGWQDEMPTPPDGVTVKMQRECESFTVEWFKIAGGNQVLEEYDWPGTIIPVIQCTGEDIVLDGKRIYQGLTRHARDSQTMLNYGMTQQAISLSLTPRAPWVAPARSIKGYENVWRNANTKNYSVLPYVDMDEKGPIEKPERQQPAMPNVGWNEWCQMMIQMIRSTIGMYQNSLGQQGHEVSGTAIRQRESQGDNATFNFADNLGRMIALGGRIIVEVIPHFYDSEQIVQTVGLDDVRKPVTINQPGAQIDDVTGSLQAIKHNDVTLGTYAVVVDTGPSYRTKRQETADALIALTKSIPGIAIAAPDLVVKSLDIADAEPIAERLKWYLPPQVQQAEQAKEQNGGKAPDPATMQKMNDLQGQLHQAVDTMHKMDAENQQLKSGAAVKIQAAQVDAAAKKEMADSDRQAELLKAQADADAKYRIAMLDRETTLRQAELSADVEIRKAIISRATQLEVAEMSAGLQIQINNDKLDAQADAAEKMAQQAESQPEGAE